MDRPAPCRSDPARDLPSLGLWPAALRFRKTSTLVPCTSLSASAHLPFDSVVCRERSKAPSRDTRDGVAPLCRAGGGQCDQNCAKPKNARAPPLSRPADRATPQATSLDSFYDKVASPPRLRGRLILGTIAAEPLPYISAGNSRRSRGRSGTRLEAL